METFNFTCNDCLENIAGFMDTSTRSFACQRCVGWHPKAVRLVRGSGYLAVALKAFCDVFGKDVSEIFQKYKSNRKDVIVVHHLTKKKCHRDPQKKTASRCETCHCQLRDACAMYCSMTCFAKYDDFAPPGRRRSRKQRQPRRARDY